MRRNTIDLIDFAVKQARKKHPYFADNAHHVISLATEELGEFAKEVNDGDRINAEAEALDLIAVLVRYLEEDL